LQVVLFPDDPVSHRFCPIIRLSASMRRFVSTQRSPSVAFLAASQCSCVHRCQLFTRGWRPNWR